MQYVIHFDIAALLITGLLLSMYISRKSYSTIQGRFFLALIFAIFMATVLDIVTAYTLFYTAVVPRPINYILNTLYLVFNNFGVVIFYIYVLSITKYKDKKEWRSFYGHFVIVVETLLFTISPFTTWIFYFDENGNYHHGSLFVVLYVLSFSLLLLSVFWMMRYRRIVKNSQTIAIVTYVFVAIATVVAQGFFPNYLLTSFAGALVLYIIYYSLEKPTDFMYRNTRCFNDRAFYDYVSNHLGSSKFWFVIVGPENVDYLKRLLSSNIMESLTNGMIDRLIAQFGQKNVFYMHRCHFAILTRDDPQKTVIDPFLEHLPEDAHYKDMEISLSYCFRILPFPGVGTKIEDVRTAVDFSLRQEYEGERILTVTENELKKVTREVEVLNCIRIALRNGNFKVYYQPILEEKSGRFHSAEALLRLKDPELGFIPPDEFIPIAERNGLISQIGEFVLKSVCRFWKEQNLPALGIDYIEVNLSAIQCMQKDLSERVKSVLEEYGVPLGCINLEITETAAVSNQEAMGRNMDELAKSGMAFSLDDYGTGYSNVDHLVGLPIEIVKIDKSIIWKACANPASKLILRHILRLIRDLGMKSVAEGVETEEMVEMLRKMGCNYYQGFLYSRPIPENDFLLFLNEHSVPMWER